MELIGKYKNSGFEAVADGVISFFDRRKDLQTNGIAFGEHNSLNSNPCKISTDISLVSIDRSDPEAFAISEVIIRGVNAGLEKYLKDMIKVIFMIFQNKYFIYGTNWKI